MKLQLCDKSIFRPANANSYCQKFAGHVGDVSHDPPHSLVESIERYSARQRPRCLS